MRLVANNIARVSKADIVLDDIAVIAGQNGTGKSTISRALMTLSSVSRRISELVQNERIRSILSIVRESFGKRGGDVFLPPKCIDVRKYSELTTLLSREWWGDLAVVRDWFRREKAGDLLVYFFPDDFPDRPDCLEALSEARGRVYEALDRKDEDYVGHVCKKAFNRAFCNQVFPVFGIDAVTEVFLGEEDDRRTNKDGVLVRFRGGEVEEFSGVGRKPFPSVMYFEPVNYVDFVNSRDRGISDRYMAGESCVCNAIARKPSGNLTIEQEAELKEAVAVIKEIITIIHGRLVDDINQDIQFKEDFADGYHLIDVKNIASGMKTMAAIVRSIENRSVRRGSMLIIDEPESNLHPEWQVQFAHFLVLLSKRLSIKILVNTHSPYFLQAIRKYSKIETIRTCYYNMTSDADLDSYHTEDVSDRIDVVFQEMAAPFDDLIPDTSETAFNKRD